MDFCNLQFSRACLLLNVIKKLHLFSTGVFHVSIVTRIIGQLRLISISFFRMLGYGLSLSSLDFGVVCSLNLIVVISIDFSVQLCFSLDECYSIAR